jgi:hypothetical protein
MWEKINTQSNFLTGSISLYLRFGLDSLLFQIMHCGGDDDDAFFICCRVSHHQHITSYAGNGGREATIGRLDFAKDAKIHTLPGAAVHPVVVVVRGREGVVTMKKKSQDDDDVRLPLQQPQIR